MPGSSVNLRTELLRRYREIKTRNPRYSLRAYARLLKVDHSALSRIMNGRREASTLISQQIRSRLQVLSGGEELVATENHRKLTLTEHLQLCRWQAAAIQELTYVVGFKSESRWIAKKLGLPIVETEEMISSLIAIGFLYQDEKGVLRDAVPEWYSDLYEDHPDSKSANLSTYRDLNRRAEHVYAKLPEQACSFSRIIFSGDKRRVDQAKKLIARFRRDVATLMGSNHRDPTDVYVVKIDFYPLTEH